MHIPLSRTFLSVFFSLKDRARSADEMEPASPGGVARLRVTFLLEEVSMVGEEAGIRKAT
jgi:hypothetical protein